MTVRLRLVALAFLAAVLIAGSLAFSLDPFAGGPVTPGARASTGSGASGGPGASVDVPTPQPTPTPRPALGGTELYGYLPYWQMNAAVVTHLESAPLTTLALFSVTARKDGSLSTGTTAYRRITGAIGGRLIDEAHARDARVDLVFTSFGADRNAVFFGRVLPPAPSPVASPIPIPSGVPGAGDPTPSPSGTPRPIPTPVPTPGPPPWQRTVGELVALAKDLGADGINVDIELLAVEDRAAYGEFLSALRARLVAAIPDAQLSVATEAGQRGTDNAAVAAAAGVDRLFLMG